VLDKDRVTTVLGTYILKITTVGVMGQREKAILKVHVTTQCTVILIVKQTRKNESLLLEQLIVAVTGPISITSHTIVSGIKGG